MSKHIAIVEDNQQIKNQIKNILTTNGYKIASCDGRAPLEDTMEQIFQLDPDLILTDISASTRGFKLLEAVKSNPRLRLVPFILVSGDEINKTRIRAYSLGADNFIAKPLNKNEIAAKIKSILNRQEEFSTAMYIDALTGIYNRRFFNQELLRQIKLHDRHHEGMALVIMDLDYFKSINDNYGHNTGDECLKAFARTISAEIRSTDIFARWGGEEFVLILERAEPVGAEHTLNKILNKLKSEPLITYGGHDLHITFSAGIGMFPSHAKEPMDLINTADQALYAAKKSGRARVILYNNFQ